MSRHLTLANSHEPTIERLSWPLSRPIRELGWSHTLVLTGRLDDGSAAELEDEIECLSQEGVKHVTVDLRQLEELDADGVHSIAFTSSHCRRRGQGFAVIAGSPAAQRALAQAGVANAGDAHATAQTGTMRLDGRADLATTTVREL